MSKFLGMGLAVALALSFGCGKKKDKGMSPEAQQQMLNEQKRLMPDPSAVATEAEDAVEEVTKGVKAAGEKAEDALKSGQSSFDALVAEAKALIEGQKYQEALSKLQAGLKLPDLTADQKSILQGLIEKATAALAGTGAGDAQKAAGNLLKGLGGKK